MFLDGVFDAVGDVIKAPVQIIETGVGAVGSLVGGIGGGINNLGKGVGEGVSNLGAGVGSGIGSLGGALGNMTNFLPMLLIGGGILAVVLLLKK